MAELKLVKPREWSINPKLRVAVVGFASSSRNLAPFQDPTWEIWGLNSLYALIPKFDRWFEIHPREHVMKDLHRAELAASGLDHYTWLTRQPGPDGFCTDPACPIKCHETEARHTEFKPIYMQEAYPQIPASVRWPREEINAWTVERFGSAAEIDYFTSTPGEMVATAIFEGASEIGIYGVDLLQEEEYAYQRPGCEYWVGIARGLGINVVIPSSSVLCKANYVYGYTEPPTDAKTAQPLVDFMKGQESKLEQQQQQMAGMVNTWQGGRQAFGYSKEKLAAIVAKATTVEEFVALIKEHTDDLDKQLANLDKQVQMGMESLQKMTGQRELASSMAAWTGAWARGDKLAGA